MNTTTDAPTSTSRRPGYLSIGILGFAVFLLGFAAFQWWHHEPAFHHGNVVGMRSWSVGETFAFGMGAPTREIHISDAQAHLATGSALATIEVVVCTSGPTSGVGALPYDQVVGQCSRLVPATDVTLHPDGREAAEDLVLLVTPLEPGTVRVEGVEVHYREGWRSHSEQSGVDAEVHAS